jgi:Ser/Thr protein kinase RdoA (MazF antagonist)
LGIFSAAFSLLASPFVADNVPAWLSGWCKEHLGADMLGCLPQSSQMSSVFAVQLVDGREAAVKVRPDENGRAAACTEAQRQLAADGFPCARPLTPVLVADGMAVHAEEWRPGGFMMRGDTAGVARRFAALLGWLTQELERVTVPPPLPNPYWLSWDHGGPGPWPAKDFLDERDQSLIPGFVVETVTRATRRLLRTELASVLGHADFETQNIRWLGDQPWAVHDWDSLAWMPEAAIVGAASGAFASAETPTLAPLDSSEEFLLAYQQRTGRPFTQEEIEVAWAASLWPAAHNARAEALFGQPPVAGAPLRAQADERLARANA